MKQTIFYNQINLKFEVHKRSSIIEAHVYTSEEKITKYAISSNRIHKFARFKHSLQSYRNNAFISLVGGKKKKKEREKKKRKSSVGKYAGHVSTI